MSARIVYAALAAVVWVGFGWAAPARYSFIDEFSLVTSELTVIAR